MPRFLLFVTFFTSVEVVRIVKRQTFDAELGTQGLLLIKYSVLFRKYRLAFSRLND